MIRPIFLGLRFDIVGARDDCQVVYKGFVENIKQFGRPDLTTFCKTGNSEARYDNAFDFH